MRVAFDGRSGLDGSLGAEYDALSSAKPRCSKIFFKILFYYHLVRIAGHTRKQRGCLQMWSRRRPWRRALLGGQIGAGVFGARDKYRSARGFLGCATWSGVADLGEPAPQGDQ